MKKYKIIVDGKTIYKEVNPENEQKFFDKYGKYQPVLVYDFGEKEQQKELNQEKIQSLIPKIKTAEKNIEEQRYEERLKSINDQLKSLDQKSETEKYNRLVNNYNSILKDYEKEYNIYKTNAEAYNELYRSLNPRVSNNPINYSLLESKYLGIKSAKDNPGFVDDNLEIFKRKIDKENKFINSTPDQILTYNTASIWFDNNTSYNEDIRKKVVIDKTHGYNPSTKELVELTEEEMNMSGANFNSIQNDYGERWKDGMLSPDEWHEYVGNPQFQLSGEYGLLKIPYNELSGVEQFFLTVEPVMNTGAGRRIIKNFMQIGGTAEMLALGLIEAIDKGAIAEGAKQGKTIEQMYEEGSISRARIRRREVEELVNRFSVKYFDEEGNIMTPADLIEDGLKTGNLQTIINAGSLTAEQSIAQLPSMLLSVGGRIAFGPIGGLVGSAILGGSVYGQSFVDDLEKRYIDKGIVPTDKDISVLTKGSLWKAGAEFAGEAMSATMFGGALKLIGAGASQKIVKAYTDSAIKRFVSGYLGGAAIEGTGEALTTILQDYTDIHVYGDQIELSDRFRNTFNSFLIGSVLGGGLSGTVSVVNKPTEKQAQMAIASMEWKAKKNKIESDIQKTEKKIKTSKDRIKKFFKRKLKTLQKQRDSHDKLLSDTFKNASKKELIDYAKRQDRISKLYGMFNDKTLSKEQEKEIDNEINKLLQEQNEFTNGFVNVKVEKAIGDFFKNVEKIKKRAGFFGFGADLKIKYLYTEEQIEKARPIIDAALKEQGDKYSGQEGLILVTKDGKSTIYVNVPAAGAAGSTNVLGHELLHYMMSKNFKTNNASMRPMVRELKLFLMQTEKGRAIIKRIDQRLIRNGYLNKDGSFKEGNLEEYFEMLSDIIDKKLMPLPDGSPSTLSKTIKDMLIGLGIPGVVVDLDTGQQIFDFVKTYTGHVTRKGLLGQITKRRVLKTKLKSKLKGVESAESQTKQAASKTEAEDIINEIGSKYGWDNVSWKTTGHVFAVKVIEEEKLLDGLIASKYKGDRVPKDFVKKVLAELTPHIRNFNPEINDSLFGWINSQIANKAGNVYNREYKVTQRTVDIDATTTEGAPIIQLPADNTIEQDFIDQIGLTGKKLEMYSELRRKLNLSKEMMDKVRQSIIKTFGTKLPDINSKKFRDELQKRFRTELKKPIQDLIGSRNNYNEFLKNNFEAVYNALPVETLIQMERSVKPEQRIFTKSERITKPTEVDKLISQGLLPKDTSRTSGPQLHTKNSYPGQAKVMAFFRGVDMQNKLGYTVGNSTLGTRKDKLAMEIGVELAFDATSETIQMPSVQEKRKGILQLQGQEQANNELAIIAKQINRDPRVKFSAAAGAKIIGDYKSLVNGIAAKGDLSGIVDLNALEKGRYVGINEYKDISSEIIRFVVEELYFSDKIYLHTTELFKKLTTSDVLPSGDTRTKGFEQFVIDQFGKIKGVEILQQYQSEEGIDIPDVYAKYFGQPFNIEVKLFKAQLSSLTINKINVSKGTFVIKKLDKLSEQNQNKVKKILTNTISVLKEIQVELKNLVNDPRTTTKDKKLLQEWNSPNDLMPDWAYIHLKEKGFFKKLVGTPEMFDQSLIEDLYLNKLIPTNYIYILGKGFFHLKEDVLGLGSTKFEALIKAPIRQVKASQKKTVNKVTSKTGYVTMNMRLLPVAAEITSKSEMDILNAGDIKSFASEQVQKNIKSIKSSKSTINHDAAIINRVKYSKSGKKKGMSTFDFDDTLGFTKSGIRVTLPNKDGEPKPNRKVIFLAGGAGSGKGNVISKLGLEKQGFKIVNSDISLEWLKKNSGLPADMRDLTKEQRSTLGKLGAESRKIARRKMMKYQGNANGVVVDGTGGSVKSMQKLVDEFKSKGYDVSMLFVDTSLEVALERNRNRKERSLLDVIVTRNHESVQKNKSDFKTMFGGRFMEVNTDNLTQQSPMPAKLVNEMNDFVSSYEKLRLDAAEFAEQGAQILEQGGEFDFTEFNDVVDGTPGPLLDKAKQRAEKFGTKDMFVLTARPQASAKPIQEFLKSQGLDIPLENITGLANSTANAKAEWFLEKFAEGYNDMYFVDDALQNVDAVKKVLDQLDIKSDVVQAKVKFSKNASKEFNKIIEESQGTKADEIISQAAAQRMGRNKGWWRIFVPPSAEDFKGLLYRFLGTGKQGDRHMLWFKTHLLDPFSKGIRSWNIYKQNMVNEYKQLKKDYKDVTKMLNKLVGDTGFTVDGAIRVYLFDKAGHDIPGLDRATRRRLINYINSNARIKAFADVLGRITKVKEGYIQPSETWSLGTIATDLNNIVNKVGRRQFLSEYLANVEAIFTPENLNKIQALYGTNFREALENILYRMENGRNRNRIYDRNTNRLLNWINGSIGAIMFINMRSALLQTISTVNFINWSDNNIFKASLAFANQVQFWKDFAMLFNSPQLKQRRAGIQIDVSASELSRAFADGKGTPQSIINWLLEKGFTPTQIADSFAISFGGASFIRNRINTYIKKGMSKAEAQQKAMLDFQEIAEETQQSSREDLISQQQSSVLGRLILAFQNVTMQYTRLTKKSLSDIVNRRGDMKTNISKVIYYGAVQNIIFASLQNALAFLLWGDEEDEELIDDKVKSALNSALDSLLRGTGIYGAMISTIKNTILRWQQEQEKGYPRRDDGRIIIELLNYSPPIGSKVRKIYQAIKTESYNMEEISEEIGVRIENPKLYFIASIIEAATNIPIQRIVRKANNLEEAITSQHETWQRIALALGWDMWSLGIKDEELEQAKKDAKQTINERRKQERIQEKEEKEQELKDKGFKRIRCSGIKSNGKRCSIMSQPTKDKTFKCIHHMKFTDGMDRDGDGIKEYRCTGRTSSGRRCRNKTENKNKRCYAHQ
tara:strand:- start:2068 stop:10656 length:8589 start_codon:yes stop_codon:yes gene_type:complete